MKVVLILGTGHCGSTLLDLILGSHSKAFSLGEVYRVLDTQTKIVCEICGEDCEFWTDELLGKIRSPYRRSLINKLKTRLSIGISKEIKFYSLIAKAANKSILIDSSKKARLIDKTGKVLIKSKQIEPYLIYLSRDGRAVVNSYFRKYPERGLESIAENWNCRIDHINETYENWKNKKIHIRYEDLAIKPIENIKKISKFIDVAYEDNMMAFWKPNHHSVNGNAGTKSIIYKFRGIHKNDQWYHKNKKEYYKNHELGIRFDERWKEELDKQQIKQIETIISKRNSLIKYGQ